MNRRRCSVGLQALPPGSRWSGASCLMTRTAPSCPNAARRRDDNRRCLALQLTTVRFRAGYGGFVCGMWTFPPPVEHSNLGLST